MGAFFVRSILILAALVVILLCIPAIRRRMWLAARQRELHKLKRPLALALLNRRAEPAS